MFVIKEKSLRPAGKTHCIDRRWSAKLWGLCWSDRRNASWILEILPACLAWACLLYSTRTAREQTRKDDDTPVLLKMTSSQPHNRIVVVVSSNVYTGLWAIVVVVVGIADVGLSFANAVSFGGTPQFFWARSWMVVFPGPAPLVPKFALKRFFRNHVCWSLKALRSAAHFFLWW